MQTKIMFFDIDGTLVDMQSGQISPRTMEALKRLKASGIRICIATGRPAISLPKFAGVEFDAYLTFNGSYCYDQEGTIFSNPIRGEDVQKIIRNAAALGKPVSVATKDRLASNGADEDLVQYYGFAHQTLTVAEDFDEVSRGEVYQLMLSCRKGEYAAILRDVTGAKIAAWWDRAVDVIPATGGKGTAVRKILEYYGLHKAESMAFGDGNNDIEMLEAVGTGVAMENASDDLKAVADDVCGHVARDGIYHYCLRHGLIG